MTSRPTATSGAAPFVAERAEHDARGFRIVPDVELRRRRDVARFAKRPAHQDEALQPARQLGIAQQRGRDIGERPGRDQDQLARVLPRRREDRVDRVSRGGVLGRLGQHGVAKPGRAVNVARVLGRVQQGRRAARPDRNVRPAAQREHRARIAGRFGEIDVASDAGDADAGGRTAAPVRRAGRRRRRCRCRRRG